MITRRFQLDDSQRCCDIINGCIVELPGLNEQAREFLVSKNTREKLFSELNGYYTLVFETSAGIQGLGALDGCEIKRVYIDKNSQHHGIGHSIIAELEQQAIYQGCDSIFLEASLSSVGFWRKHGYSGNSMKNYKIGKNDHWFEL